MKMQVMICIIIVFIGNILCSATNPLLDMEWKLYKREYNKTYKDQTEDHSRRKTWEEAFYYIERHNLAADRGEHSYWLGLNQMSDMTNEEVQGMLNVHISPADRTGGSTFLIPNNIKVPAAVDWRNHGYVTPVKNQGQCGSCWAYSATGSLEGQHFRKTGKLVSLSEQNLVDCSFKEGNKGCNGGWVSYAFDYIKRNGGIDTEKTYPYEGKVKTCRFKKFDVGATVRGYTWVNKNDEKALKTAVAEIGPISVCIYTNKNFQHYKRGVFDDPSCNSTETNHCVLIIGYGVENGRDYWLVKNSWGIGWGMDGYIMMSRNKKNQCDIASYAEYPLV